MTTISNAQRRARLVQRHLLLPAPRPNPIEVASALVALHSTEPSTVFLSIAARSQAASVADITAAMHDRGELLRHHAMRRTVWVMTPEICQLAHLSSTMKIAKSERRSLLKHIDAAAVDDPEAWLDAAMTKVILAFANEGVTTTREFGELHPELTMPLPYKASRGQIAQVPAHTKIMQLAAFEGRIVRGRAAWTARNYQWRVTEELAIEASNSEIEEAAAALLFHWLARFGPASEEDITWWTGWTKGQTRTALNAIDAEPVSLESSEVGWVAPGDTAPVDEARSVALLPALDPTPMGWKNRDWYLDAATAARTYDRFGNAGPTIWVNGRIVGGWALHTRGDIRVELLRQVSASEQSAIDDRVDRIRSFLDGSHFRLRFPSPNQTDLLATP